MTRLEFHPIQVPDEVAQKFQSQVARCGGSEQWLKKEIERIASLPEGVSLPASLAFEQVLQEDRHLLERLAE